MPELPEVETVRRGLQPVMEGARFRRSRRGAADLRWPLPKDFVKRLKGQTVTGLGRRAKYILADLSSGEVLLMHLGMSGSFRVVQRQRRDQPGRIPSRALASCSRTTTSCSTCRTAAIVTFNDPRRFGCMKLVAREGLDQEPLLRGARARAARQCIRCRDAGASLRRQEDQLKAALLDQSVVAGLGNIYVCEALHRAHLSPKRKASTIATASRRAATSARTRWSTRSRRC